MADHKISVLSGIEAIQQRPGMYIGSTSNPNHLAQEILDNAIDELMEGHANKISLTIDNDDYSVTVTDNGRGIPIHHVKLQHGQIKDSIEAACTELHSGSKFKKSSYRFSGGMHGIGLVAVNALSTELSIGVVKDNKLYVYLFNNGQLVNKQTTTPTDDIDWSTLVYFKVNPEYFTSPKFTLEHFNRRLYLIKAKFPNSEIIFNNKKIPDISLRQYVSYALGYQHELEPKYLPHLQIEDVTYKVDLFFTYNKHVTGKVTGDVNSIICSGTYQTNFETIFYNTVCEVFGEKYPRNVIINGLQAYLSLMLSHTAFSSQTKTHMTKNVSHILNNLKSELAKIIKHNPFIRDNIQEAIDDYTRRRAAKNVKVSKKRVSVENPLKDCLQIPGKTLFIVEGESADGTVSDVRDVKTEAIFPLSGKILNVSNASIDQAVSSKKFKYLLECLGVDLTKKNQSDFRYEQVKILTDADSVSAETRITFLDKQGFLRQKEIQHIKSDEIDKVVSYNKKTHKMELKRVLRVIKHKYTKDFIYRIHLYGNHFVDCTQDHVLYIYDQIQGKVVEIGPEEIYPNIHTFISTKYLPVLELQPIIDIRDDIITLAKAYRKQKNSIYAYINESDYNYDIDGSKIDISNRICSQKSRAELARYYNINYSTLTMYVKGIDNTFAPQQLVLKMVQNNDVDIKNTSIKVPVTLESKKYLNNNVTTGKQKIRTHVKIDSNIAYVIGAYTANGHWGSSKNNPYVISISTSKEVAISNIIKACIKYNYGYTIEQHNNYSIIHIKSLELCALLHNLGLTRDVKSINKFIPEIFISCSENIRIGLLQGLFQGDGSFFKTGKNTNRLMYSSISKKLIDTLSLMLKQFGCVCSITVKNPIPSGLNNRGVRIVGRHTSYSININHKHDLALLEKITGYEINYYESKFKTLRENHADLIPIKYIEKIPYNHEFVYDLEVEDNNNFCCNEIGVVLHNSDGSHITVLLLLALWKFAPNLIRERRVHVLTPPLYGTYVNKKFVPIFRTSDLKNYKGQITRFKGLGEMNPDQLEVIIRNPKYMYTVNPPADEKEEMNILECISNVELKRALCNIDTLNLERFLETVLNNSET